MHYSSYSPVCHFLLQDPSLHCIEYYPLVSSDSSINHDFVLFVEPGIHAEALQSMLPTFLFKKKERSAFVSSFCHYAGHRLVEVNKTVQTIQACTASVEQALVPGHPPPPTGFFWACHRLMFPMSASNKGGGTVRDLRFVYGKNDLFGALCGHSETLSIYNSPLASPEAEKE